LHIFLSYGHDERASLAQCIKRDLKASGHEVWFDLERLKPGGNWERYIEEGLEWASASPGDGRFVLLMTPHSVRRPDGYCLNELARAWAKNLPVIPVMVAMVEPPLSICRIQYLDIRDCLPVDEHQEKYKSKFDQLLQAIEHNRLDFEGVQTRLLNYLDPLPWEAEVSQHLARFTGREWAVTELERWLADPRRRVLWITGEAGVGKSALAAWLSAHRPEIAAFHACRYGNSDRVNPRKALSSIAYQLSTQLPHYQQRLNATNLDALRGEASAQAVFERLFVGPLGGHLPAPERPLAMLIDGLDEATENRRNELASIIGTELSKTPPWLRLIVTSRPYEEAVRGPLQGLDPWKLEAGREENIQDIRSYLRRELRPFSVNAEPSQETVERIIEKSEGLFLYVSWVRQELAEGNLALTELGKFPQGLGGIYISFFQRCFPDPEKYATTYRPVLEAICAAREPLEADYLAHLFSWSVYVKRDITKAFGSLFPVSGGRIRPFHQSVRDWLTDENRAGDYFTVVDAGHRRLADYGMRLYGIGVAEMGRYSVTHLPAHLAACGRNGELRGLLLDPDWMEAKLKATDVTALISDYDYLLSPHVTQESLLLVQGALRLSAHAIGPDPRQFASQMVGRLLPYQEVPAVRQFTESVIQRACQSWVRPLHPVLDPPGMGLVCTLLGHSDKVIGVAVSRDGRWAVSASADRTLKVWDLETGRELRTLSGHSGLVNGVAVSGDGRAVSASTDRTLKVWDLETGRELRTLSGHTGGVNGVAVSGDGRRAVSASRDRTLKVWDLETGRELRTLSGHSDEVSGVAVSGDGQRAVSASWDQTLKVWDVEMGREPLTQCGHSDRVSGVAVSGDGRRAVSASRDETLKVWDLETGRELRTLSGHSGVVNGVAVSGDGRRAVSASADRTLKVWDLETGRELRTLSGHLEWVNGVAVSGDGRWAVSASADRTLKVWDLETGRELRTLSGHLGVVSSVAVSGDGQRAVSASADRTLKVWDLETGRELRTLSGHLERVSGVEVSGDGQRAVSASADRRLKVWDLETGALVTTFTCEAAANCCAISAARTIIAGDEVGRVYLLSLEVKNNY
jgi:WD40 repeat protein